MKRNIATDLQYFATILTRHGFCSDSSPLQNAISSLKSKGFVHLESLKLHIDPAPRNTRPIVNSIDILLDVSVPLVKTDSLELPVSNYAFNMKIMGFNQEGSRVISSWHLDYDNSDRAEFVHPHFHLTYGGKAMEQVDLGNVLLLPAPRLAYPPMDIILGIDFALSNFVKKDVYEKIRQDSQYKAAVTNAQITYWKPYMLSLAHFWCKNTCGNDLAWLNNSKDLCPSLLD